MTNRKFVVLLLALVVPLSACNSNDGVARARINGNNNGTSARTTGQVSGLQQSVNERENKEIDYYSHFKHQHRDSLLAWIKTKPYLRPAVEGIDNILYEEESEADRAGNQEFHRTTLGENGYQYYSVGDMNHDGDEDFAVLLVDTRKQKDEYDRFALAIFNAPLKTGNKPAYFEENLSDISNSYIVFDKMSKGYLYLGKFESDVYCATYYPKKKTYYFKDCMN